MGCRMGKSDFKQIVQTHAPAGVTATSVNGISADVVVCDALVLLRSWGHTIRARCGGSVSLRQIVYDIFRPMIMKHSRCRFFVFAFDKASYVTSAKEHEQRERDAKVKPTKIRLIPSVASGGTWSDLVSDRAMRQVLISEVCKSAAEELPGLLSQLRRTAQIVLDYEHVGENGSEARIVTLPESGTIDYENELGEFDVLFPHYAYNRSFDNLRVVVDSVDTDMLPISMLHAAHRKLTCHLYCLLPYEGVMTFFDVDCCLRGFNEFFGQKSVQTSKLLCELYLHAGSDFVQACPGISALAFVSDYLANFQSLTPAEYKQRLSASSLQKLSGTKHASKVAQQRRSGIDADMSSKRVEYTLNYWLHSTYETHKLLQSPIGYGFSLLNGTVVPTELLQSTSKRKRV